MSVSSLLGRPAALLLSSPQRRAAAIRPREASRQASSHSSPGSVRALKAAPQKKAAAAETKTRTAKRAGSLSDSPRHRYLKQFNTQTALDEAYRASIRRTLEMRRRRSIAGSSSAPASAARTPMRRSGTPLGAIGRFGSPAAAATDPRRAPRTPQSSPEGAHSPCAASPPFQPFAVSPSSPPHQPQPPTQSLLSSASSFDSEPRPSYCFSRPERSPGALAALRVAAAAAAASPNRRLSPTLATPPAAVAPTPVAEALFSPPLARPVLVVRTIAHPKPSPNKDGVYSVKPRKIRFVDHVVLNTSPMDSPSEDDEEEEKEEESGRGGVKRTASVAERKQRAAVWAAADHASNEVASRRTPTKAASGPGKPSPTRLPPRGSPERFSSGSTSEAISLGEMGFDLTQALNSSSYSDIPSPSEDTVHLSVP